MLKRVAAPTLPRRVWHWWIRLEFKPADLWVGAYVSNRPGGAAGNHVVEIWICLVPTLPLHLHFCTLGNRA